jgi:hypothetical protein
LRALKAPAGWESTATEQSKRVRGRHRTMALMQFEELLVPWVKVDGRSTTSTTTSSNSTSSTRRLRDER